MNSAPFDIEPDILRLINELGPTRLGPRNEGDEHRCLAVVAAAIVTPAAADTLMSIVVEQMGRNVEGLTAAQKNIGALVCQPSRQRRNVQLTFQIAVRLVDPILIEIGPTRFPVG